MSNMFNGCESLSSLPNIDKWDTKKASYKGFMFDGCNKLSKSYIPQKFK